MKRMTMLLLCLFVMSACSAPGDMEVHQAWVRPTMQGENAAVYFIIHNHTTSADELIGASSPVAEAVEIHESKLENDVMQMARVPSLSLDPDEEIMLEPGGYHIMLIDIKEELVLGEHIGLVLHFRNHEDLVVEVHIEEAMPEEDHESGEEH